jgi:hypothetical protein
MFELQIRAIPIEQTVAKTNAGAYCKESQIAFQKFFIENSMSVSGE